MISVPRLILPLDAAVVTAAILKRLRGGLPDRVVLVGPGSAETEVHTATTKSGFGGIRGWFLCPKCSMRTSLLHVIGTLKCRRCAEIPYASRRSYGCRWWSLWGRAVHRLAKVREALRRRYLRLAQRDQLHRLEAELVEEVCRGLLTHLAQQEKSARRLEDVSQTGTSARIDLL